MVEEVIGVLGGPAPEGVLEEDDTVLKPCSNLVKGTCVCPEDATLLARCRAYAEPRWLRRKPEAARRSVKGQDRNAQRMRVKHR
jgi:hypothetical protein